MTKTKSGFVDAQKMHKDHPTTFEVPSNINLDSIKKGSLVKVSCNNERFWTEVISVKGNKITAEVYNRRFCDQSFNLGDTIKFEKRHIYSVMEE